MALTQIRKVRFRQGEGIDTIPSPCIIDVINEGKGSYEKG